MLLKRATWMTLIVYSLLLAAVCLTPIGGDSPLAATETRRLINNMLHVPAFALHAWLCILALRLTCARGIWPWRRAVGAAIAWFYGGALEIGQGLVAGRVSSMGDMVLNTIGVLSALLIASALPRSKAIRADGE